MKTTTLTSILLILCCVFSTDAAGWDHQGHSTKATAQNTYQESHPEIQPKTDLRPTMTVLLYPQGQAAGIGIIEKGDTITLGPREDNGLRGEETLSKGGSRSNIGDDARMDIYLPEHCNGQMVIITPGGGYKNVSTFNEGAYGSVWMTEHGIATCVLKYRLPNTHPTVPIDDVHNAFRYCRHHAAEWGIKQIGVMGGSAGGHLSSLAAVMWDDAVTRPDFAILLYPRITLRYGEECSTKDHLIGTDESWEGNREKHEELLRYWSPDTHISDNTPPVFIAMSANDTEVPPTNLIPYYTGLIEHNVPVEIHMYPVGGHGWGWSSERFNGPGKDKFSHYRPHFEQAIERWLSDIRAQIKE